MRTKQTKERGTKCDFTVVRREKGVTFAVTLKHNHAAALTSFVISVPRCYKYTCCELK